MNETDKTTPIGASPMWIHEMRVDAVFHTAGLSQDEAEKAEYGVIRLLHMLYIPAKRVGPRVIAPFFNGDSMVTFHNSWEADAWLKQRIAEELEVCPHCEGTGQVLWRPPEQAGGVGEECSCPDCGGTGYL